MSSYPFPVSTETLSGVANEFGTPVWVYDRSTIERRIDRLQIFDVVRYAQKANSNLAILSLMRKKGVVVDAVSAGEIERAIRAGYRPEAEHHEIVFTADIFDVDALAMVKKHKMLVNVGSPDMIVQLANAEIQVPVILRINPGFGHGHSQKVNTGGDLSKHGIWHSQLEECLAAGKKYGIEIVGLHMHIGSGADFTHLAKVCDSMIEAAQRFGENIKVISTGGGLPISYQHDENSDFDVEHFYRLWDEARKKIESFSKHKIRLEVEPGRYLVAESGYLVSKVCSTKDVNANHFCLVDAGFTDLVRPAFYGAFHQISIVSPNGQRKTADMVDTVVAGPLCESGDVFTQEEGGFVRPRSLPQSEVGDFLVLHDAGAYGAAMSSNYNSRKLAAEVMVDGDKLHLIRERQSFDHLLGLDRIPEL